jgi:hypothetical protein
MRRIIPRRKIRPFPRLQGVACTVHEVENAASGVPSWLLEVGTGDSSNPLSYDDDDDDESLLGLFKYDVSATGV